MQRILSLAFASGIAIAPFAAHAVAVQSMNVTGFSFQVVAASGASSAVITEATGGSTIALDTNLVAGPRNPILTFNLTDPVGRIGGTGTVTMYTTAASPATIDTSTNSLAIDLSTFTFDWDTGPFPSLCTVEPCTQLQTSGMVTGGPGSWDPMTHQFSLSWSYYWYGDPVSDHPFPLGTSYWTLSGRADPVPIPASWAMFVGGIGLFGAVMARRRARFSSAATYC